MLNTLFRKLPPVARRDAVIEALSAERGQPSFFYKLREASRVRATDPRGSGSAPVWEVNDKASGYRFAFSHGVPIPQIYGYHQRAQDIEWESLPAEFVVKTTSGTMSRGVLPLVRVDGGFRDLLSEATETLCAQDIVDRLESLHERGLASSELLVEEMLRAPADSDLKVTPDFKLFCFHGVVGMIEVVGRLSRAGGSDGASHRFLGLTGTDLGAARADLPVTDHLLAPRYLEELVAAGETLSSAIMSPFVRVDLHEREDGIVFGEITPEPGGNHVLRPDLDAALGELWEQAALRLEHQAIDAGVRQLVFGPHEHQVLG